MGLFDGILGKKGVQENMAIEPCKGGYTLKGGQAKSPRISGVYVLFNGKEPLKDEQEMLIGLMREFGVAGALAPGAVISAAYELIPEIDEYLATRDMPESLNAFLMARAMMCGLARGQAEMSRLAIDPFNFKGMKGVLIQKEA